MIRKGQLYLKVACCGIPKLIFNFGIHMVDLECLIHFVVTLVTGHLGSSLIYDILKFLLASRAHQISTTDNVIKYTTQT